MQRKNDVVVQLGRVIKQGLVNLKRNRLMIFASLLVTMVAMLVLGVSYAATANINHIISSYVEQEYTLSIFLWDSISDEEAAKFGELLAADDRIASYTYVSKAEAYEDYRSNFPAEQFDVLFADKGVDFLPVSFNLVMVENSMTDDVLATYQKVTFADLGIEPGEDAEAETNVVYQASSTEDLMDTVLRIKHYVFIGGVVATVVLIFFAVIIISNTVVLTVFSRKKEIEIMSYVGATRAYIKGPFVMEGCLIGFSGGLVSFFLLMLVYNLLRNFVANSSATEVFGVELLSFGQLAPVLLLILLAAGIVIGGVGALLSAGKHIKN